MRFVKKIEKIGAMLLVVMYFLASQPGFCGCTLCLLMLPQSAHQTMPADHADDADAGCSTCTNCVCWGEVLPTTNCLTLPAPALKRLPHIEQVFTLEFLLREIFIPPKLTLHTIS